LCLGADRAETPVDRFLTAPMLLLEASE